MQSVPSKHASPSGLLHAPAPLHAAMPAHSLSGSRPAATRPQVPSAPEPFFTAVHALQSVLQAVLQHTPSAQKPEVHSPFAAHAAPLARSAHAPAPLHAI